MNTEQELAARREARRAKARRMRQRRLLSMGLLLISVLAAVIACVVGFRSSDRETEPEAETDAAAVSTEPSPSPSAQVEERIPIRGNLMLVNADHLWPLEESATLVSVYENKTDDYNVRDTTILLEQHLMAPLNRMIEDFCRETGCTELLLCAGYRTEEYQQSLRDQAIENHGQEYADSYIALPGASEHHTGLALDFSFYNLYSGTTYDFDGTGDSAWFLEHSWEYGFVQRYPTGKESITGISTEPWHFRYVGQPHACLMNQNGQCLEEYVEWLRQYPYDGEHLTVEYDGVAYEIWYDDAEDVHLPEYGAATFSGDNCGGVIVTVALE